MGTSPPWPPAVAYFHLPTQPLLPEDILDHQAHHAIRYFLSHCFGIFFEVGNQTSPFESPVSFGTCIHTCPIKASWLERNRNCRCPLRRINNQELADYRTKGSFSQGMVVN